MNRSEIYNDLKIAGLKVRRVTKGYGYHIRMYYPDMTGTIDLGCCYVRGFDEIALCTNEIVIISRFEDMKVNVKYKYITKCDVHDEDY